MANTFQFGQCVMAHAQLLHRSVQMPDRHCAVAHFRVSPHRPHATGRGYAGILLEQLKRHCVADRDSTIALMLRLGRTPVIARWYCCSKGG